MSFEFESKLISMLRGVPGLTVSSSSIKTPLREKKIITCIQLWSKYEAQMKKNYLKIKINWFFRPKVKNENFRFQYEVQNYTVKDWVKNIYWNHDQNKNHLPGISDKWFILKLSCQGSNLDSSDSESDVLPITLQDNKFFAKI